MLLSDLERWIEGVTARLPLAEAKASSAEARAQAVEAALAALTERVRKLEAAPQPDPEPPLPPNPPGPLPVGPRVPVGPDAPLVGDETALRAAGVRPSGQTAAAVQAAMAKAATGSRVVFLPAGTFVFDQTVRVPAGVTVIGAGGATLVRTAAIGTQLFVADGDRVRFTRLKLQGPKTTWGEQSQNNARAIQVIGRQNACIDHCEIFGFCYAILVQQDASALVEACHIHHNPVVGLGYGVNVNAGSLVIVRDCTLSDCRHMLASGGGGSRPTRWELLHCRTFNENRNDTVQRGTLDTHPRFDGTFIVEGNSIENAGEGCAFLAGSGPIRRNRFVGVETGVRLYQASENGFIGTPHHIDIHDNEWVQPYVHKVYIADKPINIKIDGVIDPRTLRTDVPPPPPQPRLTWANGALSLG